MYVVERESCVRGIYGVYMCVRGEMRPRRDAVGSGAEASPKEDEQNKEEDVRGLTRGSNAGAILEGSRRRG